MQEVKGYKINQKISLTLEIDNYYFDFIPAIRLYTKQVLKYSKWVLSIEFMYIRFRITRFED